MKTHHLSLIAAEAARLAAGATHLLVPMSPQPVLVLGAGGHYWCSRGLSPVLAWDWGRLPGSDLKMICTFAPGDRLLCREPWDHLTTGKNPVAAYKADCDAHTGPWQSARSMPLWAFRLRYTVAEAARPVYLPDITMDDALLVLGPGYTWTKANGDRDYPQERVRADWANRKTLWAWMLTVEVEKNDAQKDTL